MWPRLLRIYRPRVIPFPSRTLRCLLMHAPSSAHVFQGVPRGEENGFLPKNLEFYVIHTLLTMMFSIFMQFSLQQRPASFEVPGRKFTAIHHGQSLIGLISMSSQIDIHILKTISYFDNQFVMTLVSIPSSVAGTVIFILGCTLLGIPSFARF